MVNSTVSEITGKLEVRFAKFVVTYVFVSPFCGRSFGDGRVVVIIFKPKYQYASKKCTYPLGWGGVGWGGVRGIDL